MYIRRFNNRRILPYFTAIQGCQAELASKGSSEQVPDAPKGACVLKDSQAVNRDEILFHLYFLCQNAYKGLAIRVHSWAVTA